MDFSEMLLKSSFSKGLKAIGAVLAKLRWPPVFKFVCIAVHFPYFVCCRVTFSLLNLTL